MQNRFVTKTISFPVADKHIVEIKFPLRGPDIYAVDGEEVLRKETFSILRPKQTIYLDLGSEEDKHFVEIRINLWPIIRSWRTNNWVAEVYIDGELTIPDLTPDERRFISKWEPVCDAILFTAIVIGLTIMFWRNFCHSG